jgi:predicted ester cyclase
MHGSQTSLIHMSPNTQAIRTIAQSFIHEIHNQEGQQFVPEITVAEGDIVTMRGVVHALSQSQRSVQWSQTHICRVVHGLVKEHWQHKPTEKVGALLNDSEAPFKPISVSLKAKFIVATVNALARVVPPAQFVDGDLQERNRALILSYVERFKNQQQFQVFPKYFSHRFRHHFDFAGQTNTAESFINVGVNLLAGFPDVRVTLLHVIAEGDLVVEHNSVRATHKGSWAGHAATGRTVSWNEVHIYRIADGRIVENWPSVQFDIALANQTLIHERRASRLFFSAALSTRPFMSRHTASSLRASNQFRCDMHSIQTELGD